MRSVASGGSGADGQPPQATGSPAGGEGRPRATPAEARALAHPLRLRILRLTLGEALTNKQLADRLGKDPATVLHHVRQLVETGFLRVDEVRRGMRGSREKPYRSTGKSWRLDFEETDPELLGNALLQLFLDELEEAGGELGPQMRVGLYLTLAETEALARRLYQLFEEFRLLHPEGPAEGTELWSYFVGGHRQR
ncbi:MAG: ArsR/SmtB family transcription factor [Frankiaceae bacterium]